MSVDWQAIRKAHGDDLDLNVSKIEIEKGFFKLHSDPGYRFSYREILTPGVQQPYKFVEVSEHMEAIRNARKASGIQPIDGTWDASRYDISRMP